MPLVVTQIYDFSFIHFLFRNRYLCTVSSHDNADTLAENVIHENAPHWGQSQDYINGNE